MVSRLCGLKTANENFVSHTILQIHRSAFIIGSNHQNGLVQTGELNEINEIEKN